MAGCSFLIHVDDNQCAADTDCQSLGLAGACEQGVCVVRQGASCEGGSCEPSGSPTGGPCSTTTPCSDANDLCFKELCTAKGVVEPFLCEPDSGESDAGRVTFTVQVREFISQEPPKNLVVSACNSSDAACEHPVATYRDSDGGGKVYLDLPSGFSGFLEYRSDDALTALWYLSKPLIRPTVSKDLLLVAPSTLNLLAGLTLGENGVVDPSKGLVILEAFDCAGAAVGGIHFEESKGGALAFFIVNGLPSTETDVTVLDPIEGASGGFLNAEPGFTIFSARIGVNGPLLGKYNTSVRANTVTYLDVHP
jgi:hypothetical protein